MNLCRIALIAVLLVPTAPNTVTASEPSPPVDEDVATPVGHDLWLSGPFGRLAGGSLATPATAQPASTPLDTFSRNAPLSLDAGPVSIDVLRLVVRAVPVGRPDAAEELLSDGEMDFMGPSAAGQALVVAELIEPDHQRTERAWLVEVPDRDAPADGLFDIPAPDVLVEASTASTIGSPGDGCYIDLCVEVGAPAPLDTLPELRVAPATPLTARLGDGSGIMAWEGTLEPLPGHSGTPASARGLTADGSVGSANLDGLEPPTRGAWLLTLKVVFDRERGWMTTSYRVTAE